MPGGRYFIARGDEVRERIYGTEMIEELGRHGCELSPGTLYPILHAMQVDII